MALAVANIVVEVIEKSLVNGPVTILSSHSSVVGRGCTKSSKAWRAFNVLEEVHAESAEGRAGVLLVELGARDGGLNEGRLLAEDGLLVLVEGVQTVNHVGESICGIVDGLSHGNNDIVGLLVEETGLVVERRVDFSQVLVVDLLEALLLAVEDVREVGSPGGVGKHDLGVDGSETG